MRILVDLLLPPRCPGCGLEGILLCDHCARPLYRRLAEPPGAPLGVPASLPVGIVQLEWCAMYSGAIRDALHALKYRGERRLREPLAEALAARWGAAGAGGDLVTWVPVHPSASPRSRLRPGRGSGPWHGHSTGLACDGVPGATTAHGGTART